MADLVEQRENHLDAIEQYRAQQTQFELALAALQTHPTHRTRRELQSLLVFTSKLKFFHEFTVPVRLELCRVATYEHVDKDVVVHRVGEVKSTCLAILMSGSVSMFCQQSAYVSRTTLYQGDPFGEGPLMQVLPVGTSLTTKEPCDLMKIESRHYRRVAKFLYEYQIEERVQFLQTLQVPIFQGYKRSYLYALAQALIPVKAPIKTILTQQGASSSNAMYFIKLGECKIFKEVDFTKACSREELELWDEHFGDDMTNLPLIGTKLLELAALSTGEYFGEMSLLGFDPSMSVKKAVSIVATSPVIELYQLNRVDFYRYVSGNALSRMRDYSKTYPTDADIIMCFRKRKSWNRYKQKLVASILREREAEKTKTWLTVKSPHV